MVGIFCHNYCTSYEQLFVAFQLLFTQSVFYINKPVTLLFLQMIIPLSGIPCYVPVILFGKYQVFTIGARLLYLPVKLKRVYNGIPDFQKFKKCVSNLFKYINWYLKSSQITYCLRVNPIFPILTENCTSSCISTSHLNTYLNP